MRRLLRFLKAQGCTGPVHLSTDDWRLPAIKTYLAVGFRPAYRDDTHRQRWAVIGEKLGAAGLRPCSPVFDRELRPDGRGGSGGGVETE